MSEKLSIQEAGKSRNFNGVGVIETETPEGDSCFWVPESERELESEYVFSNGTYRPKKFGFSDINVDVFDIFTDLDGHDWEIKMPDIEMPEIKLPDIKLPDIDIPGVELPDIGDIDISIDTDGLPTIDIDFDIEIHVWTEDGDTIDFQPLPDGDIIELSTEDFEYEQTIEDVISVKYDPNQDDWTITALVDASFGEQEFEPGDIIKQWPPSENVDFIIKAKKSVSIDLPDISGDIDVDAGIDVSIDVDDMGGVSADVSGMDIDGFDVDVNIDLDSLDIETEYLPDTIKIVTPPNKMEYQDGEPINLTGMVVSAYYHNGTDVWANEKYPNGIIPLGELIINPMIVPSENVPGFDRWGDCEIYDDIPLLTSILYEYYVDYLKLIDDARAKFFWENKVLKNLTVLKGPPPEEMWDPSIKKLYNFSPTLTLSWRSKDSLVAVASKTNKEIYKDSYSHLYNYDHGMTERGKPCYVASGGWWLIPPFEGAYIEDIVTGEKNPPNTSCNLYDLGLIAMYAGDYSTVKGRRYKLDVDVSWSRPKDNKILTTTLSITVNENTTNNGGTTTSGNYGGSHSSGNF